METHRRLPIQARRPVVNYLQLPGEVLHIIDLFLRKPHPTAVMMAELRFLRCKTLVYKGGECYNEEGPYIVSGPQRLSLKSGDFYAIVFHYNQPVGECAETYEIAEMRLRALEDQFRRDRRFARYVEEFRGLLPVSLIEFSLHAALHMESAEDLSKLPLVFSHAARNQS